MINNTKYFPPYQKAGLVDHSLDHIERLIAFVNQTHSSRPILIKQGSRYEN